MDEYRRYLADQVLTEDKVVTYRLLSRALKVHVNTAKQMLYDFHQWQNEKKAESVHATYLVYGVKKTPETDGHVQEDGDVEMSSSMPEVVEPFSEQVLVSTLTLAKEEHLKDVLSQYEDVTSLHVYSIAPHPMKDFQLLSDTARQVLNLSASDDLEARKTYGTIANPHVRRRERRGGVLPKPAAPKAAEVPAAVPKPAAPTKVKEEPKAAAPAPAPAPASTKEQVAAKKAPPSLTRGGSSGIMQSFAKAAAKPKKAQASKPATPSVKGPDTNMTALSDDGEDDSDVVPKPQSAADDTGRKSRKDREAELRRMMEEDDEDEPAPEEKEDTPMEEPEEEPPAPEPEKEEPAEVVSSNPGDGRRRGKRRVMRKKQIMDDQGYLVTIQEPGWESFSEDETAPPAKAKPAVSTPAAPAAKPKKSGPKGSQGNIMSFFSKK